MFDSSAQKPQSVVTAIRLIWVSLALSLIKMPPIITEAKNLGGITAVGIVIFILSCVLGMVAFLVLKMSDGRNWARIIFVVLMVLGISPTLRMIVNEFSKSAFQGTVSVVQFGLQIYATVLLITKPSRDWFQPAKE